MESSASRQDDQIPRCDSLPHPFSSRNMILPKSELVHESFLSQNILSDSKKIFCQFSVGKEQENEKTESVNENENKENKIAVAFLEHIFSILQQKPEDTKVKHKTAWRLGMLYNKSSFSFCVYLDRDEVEVHKNAKWN